MLRRFRSRLTYANVVASLALFVALGTGGAYAANTIGSTDIIDGQVKSVDVGDAEIQSADVKDQSLTTFDVSTFLGVDVVDGTLTGDDIADGSLGADDISVNEFNNTVLVGSVPAHSCVYNNFAAGFAAGSHLVVTPVYESTNTNLSYTAESHTTGDVFSVKVCNPTASAIDDGVTTFLGLIIPR